MKIKSHNEEKDIDVSNVKFQGILDANYQDLLAVFGEPLEGDLYRTDAQWKLKVFVNKRKSFPVSLYNYKTGENFQQEDGLDLYHIPFWHVAVPPNMDEDGVELIKIYLNEVIMMG